MIKKIITGIYVVVLVVAIIIGIANKQTRPNITKQDNFMDHFSVAEISSKSVDLTIARMEEELPYANIILKVRADGEMKYMFKQNKQLVTVESVYKGDSIKEGDKIYIMAGGWMMVFSNMSVNAGFVNILEKDDAYLVFIKEKAYTLDKRDNSTYRLIDTVISPVFNYEDKEHVIIEVSDNNYYVPYAKVRNNEFFVTSQESLGKLTEFKHKILSEYP